jgi:hypothetical protein
MDDQNYSFQEGNIRYHVSLTDHGREGAVVEISSAEPFGNRTKKRYVRALVAWDGTFSDYHGDERFDFNDSPGEASDPTPIQWGSLLDVGMYSDLRSIFFRKVEEIKGLPDEGAE